MQKCMVKLKLMEMDKIIGTVKTAININYII